MLAECIRGSGSVESRHRMPVGCTTPGFGVRNREMHCNTQAQRDLEKDHTKIITALIIS